jgi:hypothetical protein
MLELALAPPGAGRPELPDLDAPGVEVWRHHDDAVAAYGGQRDGEFWMRLPALGVFIFGSDRPVVAYPDEGVSAARVEDGFRRTVLPMALQVLGGEVLHASGVLGLNGAVALCAVSGTGKSTLAYGLSRRGYPLWADDAVAFEIEGGTARTTALPFRLQLREPSAEFFAGFANGREPETAEARSAPLAAVCVVERASSGDGVLERLSSGDAFPSVLAHAYCFSLEDLERKRRMLDAYLQLVEMVPVFRLGVSPGFDRLGRALDLLEREVPGLER